MSRKRKLTRRRGNDPVRVYDDGRIAYRTGGAPGAGDREMERCGSREAAELRATELRKQLLLHRPAPKANATLDDLMRAAVKHWRKVGHPTGTIQQYRSDWNTHVPPKIGAIPCCAVSIERYSAIFNQLNRARASEQVMDAVARTLGAVVTFGVLNGYFPDGQPSGGPDLRRAIVKQARATAVRQNRGRKETRIRLDEWATPPTSTSTRRRSRSSTPATGPAGLAGLRHGAADQRGPGAAVGFHRPGHARRGGRPAAGPLPATGRLSPCRRATSPATRSRGRATST